MTRYEYKTITIPHTDGTYHQDIHVPADQFDQVANQMGAEGWKVLQIDGSMIRFEREIPDGGFRPA